MNSRRGVLIALGVLALLPFAGGVAAGATDMVYLKSGRTVGGVTVVRDGFDKVELDRDGDGKADESLPSGDVARISFGDEPTAYRQAQVAYDYGRYAAAAEGFALALEDKEARAFWLKPQAGFLLGECRRRLAEANRALYPEARQAYERAVAAAPEGRLASACIMGAGLCLLEEGKIAPARKEFEKLLDPKYGEDWVLRGKVRLAEVLSAEKKHAEALKLCDEALHDAELRKRGDLLKEFQFARPRILIAAGDYAKARELLLQIAAATPEQDVDTKAAAYNNLGDSLLGQDAVKDALLAYLRVRVLYFKSGPEYPRALFGSARCFALLKEADKAREIVAILKKEYPESVWTARADKEL